MLKSNHSLGRFILYSAENVSAMLFGLVGMALIARVFGPENMGRLSIVQAVSIIFMFLATFGLDHFVVRDFTNNKNDGELKGSLIFLQSVGWLLYVASILIYFSLQQSLTEEIFLILSVAISTYFLRVLFLKLYLQAVNDARSIAIAAVLSRIVAVVYLLIGSFNDFSFEWMVLYLPIQAILQALLMFRGYQLAQVDDSDKMQVSLGRIKSMLKEAMPVILSTGIYFAYNQADILLVSHFMSVTDVGIYSAAMRLVPQAAFLGHITVITFYSDLNRLYQENQAAFLAYATKIVRIQFTLSLLLACGFSLLAPYIISILYGDKFSASAPVFAIGVWAWVFMFPAALYSRLLVLTKIAKYELIKVLIVAPISLGLNFILIPQYGYIAAATVAVTSFMLADFLIYALFKETRFMFKIGVDALIGLVRSPVASIRESVALFKA